MRCVQHVSRLAKEPSMSQHQELQQQKVKQHQVVGGRWVVHEPHREAGPFWHCRIRDLVNGRTLKFSTRERSLPRARQAARDHAGALAARENQMVDRRGFAEGFAEYLDLRSLAPKTQADYKGLVAIMADAFEGLAVDEVEPKAVERFVKGLAEKGRAPKTVAAYVTLLRSFYRWAIRHGHARVDPTEGIKTSRRRQIEPVGLSIEGARRLLRACREETVLELSYEGRRNPGTQVWRRPAYLHLAVLTSLYTGLRRANVLGLRWKEIDLKRRAIRIDRARMKARRDHEVPIHPVLAEALKEALVRVGKVDPERPVLGEAADDPGRAFEGALRRAGLPRMRWHDLRVTFATWIGDYAPHAVCRRLLGHTEGNDVTLLYNRPSFETLRDAVDRLPDLTREGAAAAVTAGAGA